MDIRSRMKATAVTLTFTLLTALLSLAPTQAEVFRTTFTNSANTQYLKVEVLSDHLAHFELAAGSTATTNSPIYTSPMVFKTDYSGPTTVSQNSNTLETPAMRVEVNPSNLCIKLIDKTKADAELTTICPVDLGEPLKGLNINPGEMENVYGLGQKFKQFGSADGDWTLLGVRDGANSLGNGFEGISGQSGMVGNVQIPVYYAVGKNNLNYALFMDNVYWQRWDFTKNWWEARMYGDQLRFYFITGADLASLRSDYMELTGRPPVPPRKAFGLWVSEFGYDNWDQIDLLKNGLRSNHFPIDGFVLDLNWFGGIGSGDKHNSNMGRLNWDTDQDNLTQNNGYFYSDPGAKIKQYAADHIALAAIEESYLANTDPKLATENEIPPALMAYHRNSQNRCDPANQNPAMIYAADFWGNGWMFDWSDPQLGPWIHNHRRYPNLVKLGIDTHWTDLGEPERYDVANCYNGVETTAAGIKNHHSDIHNLYNLLWNQSIWQGYVDKQGQADDLGVTNPRPMILTRSGAAGTQRYGTAMWSGDIGSNLGFLASHFNAQMQMSFSGIDYYGADIGGFRREGLPGNSQNGPFNTAYQSEMFTQWFANGSWFDVPVRPHTDNEFGEGRSSCSANFGHRSPPCYETSPDRIGKTASNLANIRQRYELIPYYYSLAYRAYLYGEPVMPPLVFYYQDDENVRQNGNEKLIGKDLLVAVVASHGEYQRNVYLPAGDWIDYYSNEWVSSEGEQLEDVPVYRNGILRLPAFVRAGAIIPQMYVGASTEDAFGHEANGVTAHHELILKVYADPKASTFSLYEDDGKTLNYTDSGRPLYAYRTTELTQRGNNNTVQVTINAAINHNGSEVVSEPYVGALSSRSNVVKLVVKNQEATAVKLNGVALTKYTTQSGFDAANSGWFNAGNNIVEAKSKELDIYTVKDFSFTLEPATPTTSVNFICDNGVTVPGQSVYVVGNIAALGSWDPADAVKLDPNIYYNYIVQPDKYVLGPTKPVWTGVISNLPANTDIKWKCIKRSETEPSQTQWQGGENNRKTTNDSGYSGNSYASF